VLLTKYPYLFIYTHTTGMAHFRIPMVSHRNEYQEYLLGDKGGWCVGLTTLPPPCADCLEIWESQHPGTFRACRGLWLYLYLPYYRAPLKRLKLYSPSDN